MGIAGDPLIGVPLSVLAVTLMAVAWRFRKLFGSYIEVRVKAAIDGRKFLAERRKRDDALEAGSLKQALRRKQAALNRAARRDEAQVQAAAAAVPEITALIIEAERKIQAARADGAAKAAARKAEHIVRRRLQEVMAGVIGTLAWLVPTAIVLSAIGLGISQWHWANTHPHTALSVVVCKAYVGEDDWGDPIGEIDTSKGLFVLDPLRIGNTVYGSSTQAVKAFKPGDIDNLIWHGGTLRMSHFVTAVVKQSGAGKCVN